MGAALSADDARMFARQGFSVMMLKYYIDPNAWGDSATADAVALDLDEVTGQN